MSVGWWNGFVAWIGEAVQESMRRIENRLEEEFVTVLRVRPTSVPNPTEPTTIKVHDKSIVVTKKCENNPHDRLDLESRSAPFRR